MTVTELRDKKNEIKAKADAILKAAEDEGRELTADEQTAYDELVAELDEVETQIAEAEAEVRSMRVGQNILPSRFSLMNAIRSEIEHRAFSPFETEILNAGKAEMQRANLSFNSNIVLPIERRASIQATVSGAGIENVPTDKLAILPKLRNRLVMVKAGAQFLTGLVGNISIPVYAGSNVAWAAETGAAIDAGGTFTQIAFAPKRLTANLKISKQFLLQDNFDAEALLMTDLVNAISEKLETTLLGTAAGSATQPAGLGSTLTPSTVATFADVVALEGELEAANVYDYKYILSPSMKSTLRTTPKEAGQAIYIYSDNNEINGYPALASASVATDTGFVGDWSDYVIASWGGIEVTVDPYTLADQGLIRLVVNSYFDGKPRRATSFKAFEL